MTVQQDGTATAVSRFLRAMIDAECRGYGSVALLDQAGSIVSLVVDAGLHDLLTHAEELSKRAIILKVRE